MTIMKSLFPYAFTGNFGNRLYSISPNNKPPAVLGASRKFTHLRMLQKAGNAIAAVLSLIRKFAAGLLPRKKTVINEAAAWQEDDTCIMDDTPILIDINKLAYTGWPGEDILILAANASEAGTVYVSIVDGEGVLVEDGIADLDEEKGCWIYTAQQRNPTLPGTTIVATCFNAHGEMSSYGTFMPG